MAAAIAEGPGRQDGELDGAGIVVKIGYDSDMGKSLESPNSEPNLPSASDTAIS